MDKALREVFFETMIELAEKNEMIVGVDCDVGRHTMMNKFMSVYPNRVFDVGICEQHAVSFAAGMSECGRLPVVATFAAFLSTRAWEQIRHSVIYNNTNVKLFATHAGLAAGEDGATHQCFEDFALMLALPNIEVFAPAFKEECRVIAQYVIESKLPCYIRVGRESITESVDLTPNYIVGDAIMLINDYNAEVALVSTGEITIEVMRAGEILAKEGVAIKVLHVGALRPLNVEKLKQQLSGISTIFVIEEHCVHGGLYSLINSAISERTLRIIPLCIFGVFGQTGTVEELRDYFGLSAEKISKTVVEHISEASI